MQTLSDLLVESNIFANREMLSPHYVPKRLIGRQKEINQIERAIAPALKGERGRNVFIYGLTGVGKTSCVRYVVDEVKNIPNTRAKITYVNCRIYSSRYKVLNKIISEHLPTYAKRGYGAVDLYEKLTNWIEEDSKILVIVLDEIDVIKDLDDLVYTLTRINSDIRAGGVAMVGISNKVSFKDSLDPRSISSLYESEIVFSNYNANELFEILKDRVSKGFRQGAVDDEVLRFIAATSAKSGGDARLSLKTLSKAGELSDENNEPKVTLERTREAVKLSEGDIVYDVVATLPEHQRLVLYSIALLTQAGGSYKKLTDGPDTYLFSGEIYSRYKSIAENLHKDPKGERWYRKYLYELSMQGLILTFESGKGIRGHTKLIKLLYPAEKIRDCIEKDVFGYPETSQVPN